MGMNLQQVIDSIRREATGNRNLGDRFERIVKEFLKRDPRYKDLFSKIWLWNDWPDRKEGDTGVDIVAKEATGKLWAIQCKFYKPEHQLRKSHIDSFFTTSGRYQFSRRVIISTTNYWSENAERALEGQTIPCQRWGIRELAESPVEWESIYNPERTTIRKKKTLHQHQKEALQAVISGFTKADRGKLIMACGTGKTLTSLRIAENMLPENGSALFLVPSISLLSQSLREWTNDARVELRYFAVCSDSKIGKDNEDMRATELAFPTTTDHEALAEQLTKRDYDSYGKRNIVFSTYHSIDVVAKAQQRGAPAFDLVICDEAHRTTGVERRDEEASYFIRIHDATYIRAKKRLYMTATPRIYSESAKEKAAANEFGCISMDEEKDYGREFYRLDFSEAVEKNLLSDYKVLVLAVNEDHISATMQDQLAEGGELNLEDTAKIIGCYKGLKKEIANSEEAKAPDLKPMRRAVAFCTTIKNSKLITGMFQRVTEEYHSKALHSDEKPFKCEAEHVDGTQNSLLRNLALSRLKNIPDDEHICRILSNARCLSEGVDVPALDAVMFLNPRKSVVDLVQSVGRVMRKTEGKHYGYVILPVAVPAHIPPNEALADNKRYQVVWEVLQALRSHDNRFNSNINKMELNKALPPQINIIGVGFEDGEDGAEKVSDETHRQFHLNFDGLQRSHCCENS